MAAFMLTLLALPVRPMSMRGAVVQPKCGGIGRPRLTFTVVSKAISLVGICPWSWYCATTRSNSPLSARTVANIGDPTARGFGAGLDRIHALRLAGKTEG